jgi:hypothetical protein
VDLLEKEYFTVVSEWNGSLRSTRNKIRLLMGETEADRFLDYADDTPARQPTEHSLSVCESSQSCDVREGGNNDLNRSSRRPHAD